MTIEVEAYRDLATVANDAGSALDRHAQPVLFDRLDWFALNQRFVPAGVPLVLRAREGEGRAWLFLASRKHDLLPLGSWYTLAFAPVFTAGLAAEQRQALLGAICRALREFGSGLTLWPLAPDVAAVIAGSLRQAGWRVRAGETSARWHGRAESWPAYWAARPSRLRNTVRRRQRSHPVEARLFDTFSEAAWAAYETVSARSWKPTEGSMPFLRALAEQEAGAGTLRLALGMVEGEPVAAQLWLVENGTATLHKIGQDRAHDRRSPGSQLMAATIERLLAREGPLTIDLGTGDDAYKRDWADHREPLLRLEAADPRTLRGCLRAARWTLAALVRRERRS